MAAPDKDTLTLADFMPGAKPAADGLARAGRARRDGAGPADEAAVIEALRQVHDPEIPVNLYDLGLIYRIDRADNGDVAIDMTLTAPACPVAGLMPGRVAEAVAAAPSVGEVTVRLVWEPRWTKERMSEDARLALGLF